MPRFTIDNLPAPIDWEQRDPVLRIVQNAKNLLMAHMGEVPFDRYRGLDPSIYDQPLTKVQGVLPLELDRILLWEPGANVVAVYAGMDDHRGLVIKAVIEVEPDAT